MIWFTVALLILIAELMTGTFYLLVLSVALSITACVDYFFHPSTTFSLVLTAIISLVGVVGVYFWNKGHKISRKTRNEQDDLDINQVAVVKKVLSSSDLLVWYRGTQWQAMLHKPLPEDMPLETRVKIVGKKGNILIVEVIG